MEHAQWIIMQPHAFICSLTSIWTCWPTASRRGWCLLGRWWRHRYASCGTACRRPPAWCPASCQELPALCPGNAASARPGTHLDTKQDTVTAKKKQNVYLSIILIQTPMCWESITRSCYKKLLKWNSWKMCQLKDRGTHPVCGRLSLSGSPLSSDQGWGWKKKKTCYSTLSQMCLFCQEHYGNLRSVTMYEEETEAERFVYLVVLASEAFSAAGI